MQDRQAVPVRSRRRCRASLRKGLLPGSMRAVLAYHRSCTEWHRRYSQGVLIEVNAHSLFSKWFSESGKLVGRLFAKIQVRCAGGRGRWACRRVRKLCQPRPAREPVQPA